MLFIYFLLLHVVYIVEAYNNNLFYLIENRSNALVGCAGFNDRPKGKASKIVKLILPLSAPNVDEKTKLAIPYSPIEEVKPEPDPFFLYQSTLNKILFGDTETDGKHMKMPNVSSDELALYPSGQIMRSEVFQNKKMVHLPRTEFMHPGHLYLNTNSPDFMQTAVNAFGILVDGSLEDVYKLPSNYVLRSARSIAMMKIEREKLVATWEVVKRGRKAREISHSTLEYYRPLFKYVNGREISRLNLTDERILSFVGTHPDLNRHQVGVIASEYIKKNNQWNTPIYLNLMNNLLCGVPMKLMKIIPENVYLQLSHQVFYHIRACDPLQRRFYLAMMTRTQVLGKSNSWGARDVARLGLLLTEVEGRDLNAINPEAMVGITPQVMLEMAAIKLKYLTEKQIQYISQKSLNIMTKKLHAYDEETTMLNSYAATFLLTHFIIYVVAIKVVL